MMSDVGSAEVSTATLIEGAWWALEQCGRLLRSARTLFATGDPATAVAVAMLAREELGRSRLLAELGSKANAGSVVTVRQVQDATGKHEAKQRHGALSVVVRPEPGTPEHAALERRSRAELGTEKYDRADAAVQRIVDRIASEQPRRRHVARLRCTYVDISTDGRQWMRPCSIEPGAARQEIEHAVNDYANARDRWSDELLSSPDIERAIPDAPMLRQFKPAALVLPEPAWL